MMNVVVVLTLCVATKAVSTTSQGLEMRHTQTRHIERIVETIPPTSIKHERGFCYIATLRMGRAGDKGGKKSICVLLENGRPLPFPHSLHADIRSKGRGRYSHWTSSSLYFSSSDNTDPRTNGRRYELVSARGVRRHRLVVRATRLPARYRIERGATNNVSNRRLVIRNLDSKVAVVPRLSVVGWPDLTSIEGMLRSVLRPNMSPEEKAIAIWKFLVRWRYHYYPAEGGDEVHDPVKFINVYGYGFCDDSAKNFAVLCRRAGLRARVWGLSGHVVGEAFYNGRWHMFDPDHEVFYRMPDGHIASVEELAAHPEIITATPRDPIGSNTKSIARLYTTTDNNHIENRKYAVGHRLEFTLEPGDEVVYDWTRRERAHCVIFANKPLPPKFANGQLVRRVDLTPLRERGQQEILLKWPYVLVGLRLELNSPVADGAVRAGVSSDGKNFVSATLSKGNDGKRRFVFDKWLIERKRATYAVVLRLERAGDGKEVSSRATLRALFQFAPRAAPQVEKGGTEFLLDATFLQGANVPANWSGLEVVHEWDEVLEEVTPPSAVQK